MLVNWLMMVNNPYVEAPVDGGDGDGVLRHQQIVESILGFSIPILGAVMPQGVDRP